MKIGYLLGFWCSFAMVAFFSVMLVAVPTEAPPAGLSQLSLFKQFAWLLYESPHWAIIPNLPSALFIAVAFRKRYHGNSGIKWFRLGVLWFVGWSAIALGSASYLSALTIEINHSGDASTRYYFGLEVVWMVGLRQLVFGVPAMCGLPFLRGLRTAGDTGSLDDE